MPKCKHKWKLVYEGNNIQIVEKESNRPIFLEGKWKVYKCHKTFILPAATFDLKSSHGLYILYKIT